MNNSLEIGNKLVLKSNFQPHFLRGFLNLEKLKKRGKQSAHFL